MSTIGDVPRPLWVADPKQVKVGAVLLELETAVSNLVVQCVITVKVQSGVCPTTLKNMEKLVCQDMPSRVEEESSRERERAASPCKGAFQAQIW